jgi:transposase
MAKSDYGRQMLKQMNEMIKKCDDLTCEIKEARREIKRLNQKVEILETENQVLKEDNDRLRKIINNGSNNSSKPPSSDEKPNTKIYNGREKSGKKAGAQKGHQGHQLSKKEVEEKIQTGELKHKIVKHGKESNQYKSKYILDIQINAVAQEHRFYVDGNGKYNIPAEFKTDVQYGTNIKTLCTSLNVEGYVALDRLEGFIKNLTQEKLTPSKGTIVNFIQECNNRTGYLLDKFKEKLLNATLIHTDATVSRCNNINQSVRNYSTNEITLLVGTRGKSKKHIQETNLLPQYNGILVHDHETVIYNYGRKHGECNVHILRYLKGCTENTKHQWAKDMSSLLCCVNNSKKRLNRFEKPQLERISKRYDEILQKGIEENKKLKSKYYKQDERKLLRRLQKYKDNHLLFAYDFTVPFDNNLSERDLRNVKSKLKVSGCFRNERGMQNYLNLQSIIGTCRKKSINFYDTIEKIFKNIPIEI